MDFICWLQDGSIWDVGPGLSTNPIVFFKDAEVGYCGATFPQKVLEVQGTGGKFTDVVKGLL